MTTKYRYFIYLLLLHLLIGGLCFYILQDRLYWLLLVEVAILASLAIAFQFYSKFMAPTELIDQGEAAMSDGDFTAKFRLQDSPEVDRLIRLYNEMIDNLREERTGKAEQHYFMERLMGSAELGIIILDYDGDIATINAWARQRLRLDPAKTYQRLDEISHPLGRQLQQLEPDRPTVVQQGGQQRYRIEQGQFIDQGFNRTFILIQDITKDLLTAEKEAYGKVIRMMAHEVNNSIGATNSMLQSLRDTDDLSLAEQRELVAEYLPLVIERSERMNDFMRNFANVIRLPEPKMEEVDLAALLENAGRLYSVKLEAAGIELEHPVGAAPQIVRGDAGQLEQVLYNALTNSLESIGSRPGKIVIGLLRRPAGFTVADNGPGIAPGDADKLFTPFFSTKATGQGIGLTLSRDILQAHEAEYSLRTDPDGWTRFRVTF